MGLCNGTRLQLLSYSSRLLKVKILNGSHEGQETYLPRIDLLSDDEALPFVLKRQQFPVKLAFAMTKPKTIVTEAQRSEVIIKSEKWYMKNGHW